MNVLEEHAASVFRLEMNQVGKGQFCMEEVLRKLGRGEETDHLTRAGEVEEEMEPGRANENIALKRCDTLGTGDIQDETTKGQEIFESATMYRHIRSMVRGDRSRPLLRKSLFLFFWV